MILKLLSMTVSGSLLICAILGLRALLQHRVHRNVWLLLWTAVILRLLVPVTVTSPVSIFNLPIFGQTAPAAVPVSTQTISAVPAEVTVGASAPQSLSPAVWLPLLVWGCGLAAVLLTVLILHLRNRRSYRFSLPVEVSLPLPPGVRVRQLEGLAAPLTYGLFRPVILVPLGMGEEPERLAPVLQHELAHVRHRDVGYKALLLLTAGVHWFNPLVWLMVYVAGQDLEMRADAEAVVALGGQRRSYAEALVSQEVQKLRSYLQTGFSYSGTGQRVKALARAKVRKGASIAAACLLLPLLLGVFATGRVARAAAPEAAPPAMEALAPSLPAQADRTEQTSETTEAVMETEALPPETEENLPEETEAPPVTEAPAPAATGPKETVAPSTTPPETAAPPTTTAPPATTEGHRAQEAIPGVVYTLGALTLSDGDQYTAAVGTVWAELYSDNPAVVQVGSVYENGGVYYCSFTAKRDGSANVYARVNGSWRLFATVTVLP